MVSVSCRKKETPPSSPVFFTNTTYDAGSFDASGTPTNLGTRETISPELLAFANNTLPSYTDLRKTNPELLTTKAIADITLTQKSNIKITFVASVATGNYNTLGYYTYPTSNPPASAKDISKITYIFPSAGGGSLLQAGDNVTVGPINAGMSVGFVLLANAWTPTTKTVNTKAVHFASNDVLNPEFDPALKKHAVLINYTPENRILIGLEDTDRTLPTCDHDFNDLVVYATVTPAP